MSSVPRACCAPCNRSAGAMCARSTPPNGGAGLCGRGATGRLRSTARPTSWPAAAILSSTRRARMVAHPADYRWSSYRAHAHGYRRCPGSDHPLYHALGRGAATRQTLSGLAPSGTSGRVSWTRCTRQPMVGGRLAAQAPSASSPTRSAAKRPTAQRACHQTAPAQFTPTTLLPFTAFVTSLFRPRDFRSQLSSGK